MEEEEFNQLERTCLYDAKPSRGGLSKRKLRQLVQLYADVDESIIKGMDRDELRYVICDKFDFLRDPSEMEGKGEEDREEKVFTEDEDLLLEPSEPADDDEVVIVEEEEEDTEEEEEEDTEEEDEDKDTEEEEDIRREPLIDPRCPERGERSPCWKLRGIEWSNNSCWFDAMLVALFVPQAVERKMRRLVFKDATREDETRDRIRDELCTLIYRQGGLLNPRIRRAYPECRERLRRLLITSGLLPLQARGDFNAEELYEVLIALLDNRGRYSWFKDAGSEIENQLLQQFWDTHGVAVGKYMLTLTYFSEGRPSSELFGDLIDYYARSYEGMVLPHMIAILNNTDSRLRNEPDIERFDVLYGNRCYVFELQSVVSPSSVRRGEEVGAFVHYVAFAKCEDSWYFYDDMRKKPVQLGETPVAETGDTTEMYDFGFNSLLIYTIRSC